MNFPKPSEEETLKVGTSFFFPLAALELDGLLGEMSITSGISPSLSLGEKGGDLLETPIFFATGQKSSSLPDDIIPYNISGK